ncbi:MAG: putative sigma-54 modulation protein [Flavobacteriales bacterium]|jgi:putative sigma-54 modulation protein
MKIHIHAKGFDLTKGIKSHAEKRIHLSLARMQAHITSIEPNLSDINGPKGGIDKQCKISIHSNSIASITIRDTKADLYEAIDNAINRASYSLIRKVSRSQKLSRINRRPAVTEVIEEEPLLVDTPDDIEEHYYSH